MNQRLIMQTTTRKITIKFRVLRFILLILLGFGGSVVFVDSGFLQAQESQEQIESEEQQSEKQIKKKKKRSIKKSKKKTDNLDKDISVQLGFLTLIPPYPSIQLSVALPKDILMGFEYGYLAYSSKEFSAKTSYMGVDFKYGFFSSDAFFYGLGFGIRTVKIEDPEDYKNIGTTESGAQTEETSVVTWASDVKQNLLMPRVGWKMYNKNGFIISSSLGVSVPFGTKLELTRDVESISGKSKDDLDSEKDEKNADTNKYVTMVLPLISFGLSWCFDFW